MDRTSDRSVMRDIEQSEYKYLGILESDNKNKCEEEFIQERVHEMIVLDSQTKINWKK